MRIYFLLAMMITALQTSAMADVIPHNPKPFGLWLEEVKEEAQQKNISSQTIKAALDDIEAIDRIIELDRKQPESTFTFNQYRKKILNNARVRKGRSLRKKHAKLLKEVTAKYNVQPAFIVALWGIETNFGQNMGSFNVVEALATLAYDGRRSEFFRKEMFNAMQIIDDGHISADDMIGSWAGAMGQCQFMPSSFNNFAVDGNGDGKRDIWNNQKDVFASIANYLSKSGWKGNESWGMAVKLPKGFNKSLANIKQAKPVAEWKRLGIKTKAGKELRNTPKEGWLVFVESDNQLHPLLIFGNYKTLLKWNRSRYFATAVGLLAEQIEQGNL